MSNHNNNETSDYILIDIRNSDEVLAKHFDDSKMKNFYNIPMNMIRFNVEVILDHLKWVKNIYIVCNSGNRSRFIKEKYFSNEPRIVVDDLLQFNKIAEPGEYNYLLENNQAINIWVNGSFKYNMYNITRLVQTVLGTIMILCSLYLWKYGNCSTKIPIYILLGMGTMALINGLTNTCTMALLLRNVLN